MRSVGGNWKGDSGGLKKVRHLCEGCRIWPLSFPASSFYFMALLLD